MTIRLPRALAILSLLALNFITPACGVIAPPGMIEASETLSIETIVAATLTALAPYPPPATSTLPPSATPTAMPPSETPPTETPTPLPTPTSTTPPPVLSVVYIKNGDIWLWSEAGGSVRLTELGDVTEVYLSDDSQIAAFVRQAEDALFHPEIWAVNVDGARLRPLVTSADFSALYGPPPAGEGIGPLRIVWQPRAHVLAYNTYPICFCPGPYGYNDLYTVDADTMEKNSLFGKNKLGEFYFSPDGAQIALASLNSISLVNSDGSNHRPQVLTFEPARIPSDVPYYPHPIWAADSSALRVAIPPVESHAEPPPPTMLYFIPTDGSPAYPLGSVAEKLFTWSDNTYSPDLSHIAYERMIGEPTNNWRELRLAGPTGADETVYFTGESVFFYQWLPDSRRFLFVAYGAVKGLYLGQVGGGYYALTGDPNQFQDIRWLDDNRYFCLQRAGGDVWELRLITLGGDSVLLDIVTDTPAVYDFVYR